jgi:hypothetical protein
VFHAAKIKIKNDIANTTIVFFSVKDYVMTETRFMEVENVGRNVKK